jgi:23S rRNA pseudouridine2605 synthase
MSAEPGERLQKVLARAGLGSRRSVEALIEAGRVRVNGQPVKLGARVNVSQDKVEVDGYPIPVAPLLVYYLVNKPVGVVSTVSDPHGRPTVLEFVPGERRLWPVGRLDADTEGALLVTNDGDLTFRLTHPSMGVEKTYVAEVRGSIGARAIARLQRGVELDDGPTAGARAKVVGRTPSSSLVELSIHEGRHRQVRRMLEAVGHPVLRLARVAIGPVTLGRLRPGTARRLRPEELRALYATAKETSRQGD